MNNLQATIYTYVASVPAGFVTTYKQVAEKVGTHPRVVGRLLHKNSDPTTIPCHRVIKSDGSLATGYAFGGYNAQVEKLTKEGITLHNNRVDLTRYLWTY